MNQEEKEHFWKSAKHVKIYFDPLQVYKTEEPWKIPRRDEFLTCASAVPHCGMQTQKLLCVFFLMTSVIAWP